MPDHSDGNATPEPGGDARDNRGSQGNDGQQSSRRNRNRRPSAPVIRKFEGKCEALKGHVYDVSHVPNNYELFNATTEAIGEYVATEYEYAGEYRRGLPDLNLPTLVPPG
jgi:hypothetical protein